jgi:hypothetical protein
VLRQQPCWGYDDVDGANSSNVVQGYACNRACATLRTWPTRVHTTLTVCNQPHQQLLQRGFGIRRQLWGRGNRELRPTDAAAAAAHARHALPTVSCATRRCVRCRCCRGAAQPLLLWLQKADTVVVPLLGMAQRLSMLRTSGATARTLSLLARHSRARCLVCQHGGA